MQRGRNEPDQEKLPQLTLEYVAYAEPCHSGAKHLSQVGEREIEPQGHEKHESIGVVDAIVAQRLIEQDIDEQRQHEDEDVAIGREPRYDDVEPYIARLTWEIVEHTSVTIGLPIGGDVGNAIESLAIDVAVVAAKHVAHAHEKGYQSQITNKEDLASSVTGSLERDERYGEKYEIKPHKKDVLLSC